MTYTNLTKEGRLVTVTIKNMREAEAALLPYVPLVKQLTGKDTTLARIEPLMALLGNPEDLLRVIHIAGTSGKTSTAYYMTALLRAAGQKVGLTVSPHIDSVRERVQIDGEPLAEVVFCRELAFFLDIVRQAGQQPSYFELLFAFAVWVFARQGVDYAVIETGLGGLHDATNVLARADKVCVITDIGFDHMGILGRTLPAIAAQKVGIVHDHNPVFMYQQDRGVMTVITEWIAEHRATLDATTEQDEQREFPVDTAGIPDYQRRNWRLAYRAYRFIQTRDGLPHLTSKVLCQTQLLQVPARMDICQVGAKTITMDGAHNAQKMATFIASFQRLYPDTKPAVLLALKDDKAYAELVPLLSAFARSITVTTFQGAQDLPVRPLEPAILAQALAAGGMQTVQTIADPAAALETVLAGPEKLIVITGSFYLLAQLRHTKPIHDSLNRRH